MSTGRRGGQEISLSYSPPFMLLPPHSWRNPRRTRPHRSAGAPCAGARPRARV